MPSTTSSVEMPRWSASCGTVGERPSCCVSSSVARRSRRCVSFADRGTRDRPRVVAEVALDLALDGAAGERREGDVAVGLEAVDRLHERQEGDLAEVVVARPAPPEAAGDMGGEAHVPLDQLVAQAPVVGRAELTEECVLVDPVPRPVVRDRLGLRASRRLDPLVRENEVPSSWWSSTTASTIRRVSSSISTIAWMPPSRAPRTVIRPPWTSNSRSTRDSGVAASTISETNSLTPRRRSSRSSTLSPASTPSEAATTRAAARKRGDAGTLSRTGCWSDVVFAQRWRRVRQGRHHASLADAGRRLNRRPAA